MQNALFETPNRNPAPELSLEGAALLKLFACYPGKIGYLEAQCLAYLLGEAGFVLKGRFELINQIPESKAVNGLLRTLDKGGYLLGYHPDRHLIGHLRVAQDAFLQVGPLLSTFPKAERAITKVLEWLEEGKDLRVLAKFRFLAKENHLESSEALVAHLKAKRQFFYPEGEVQQLWGKVTAMQA